MSMTRKDIFAQLDAEKAERARIETETAAKVAELTQALEAEKARADAAEENLRAGVEAAAKTVEDALAKVDTAEKAASEVVAKLAGEIEAHAATQKLLTLAKAALADPAMVDAAMTALNGGVTLQASRDAEADKAESEATKPAPVESILDQWDKLTDPVERRRFYEANKAAIKEAAKNEEA